MPVYLFALSQAQVISTTNAFLAFGVLHLLVYPSSNGYNSYIDRDEAPIGGVQKPMQPTRQLYYITCMMDVAAVFISLFVSVTFAIGVLLYITASRLYSSPFVRLKKYPVTGFLIVFFCQGALIFLLVYGAVTGNYSPPVSLMIAASCLIGALYPLTQIYQHAEDRRQGIESISMLLGMKGTFIFSMALFSAAVFCLLFHWQQTMELNHFWLFLLMNVPVLVFFFMWMIKVWKDERKADFRHSLYMNVISTACTGAYFLTLIMLNR